MSCTRGLPGLQSVLVGICPGLSVQEDIVCTACRQLAGKRMCLCPRVLLLPLGVSVILTPGCARQKFYRRML